MAVVGSDYDRLKRYNPAEFYNPTPKPPQKDVTGEEDRANAPPEQWSFIINLAGIASLSDWLVDWLIYNEK